MGTGVKGSFDLSQQNNSTKICGVDNSSGLKTCLAVYIGSCFHTETFHLHYFLILVYGPMHQMDIFGWTSLALDGHQKGPLSIDSSCSDV